jgi:hypothetical protein
LTSQVGCEAREHTDGQAGAYAVFCPLPPVAALAPADWTVCGVACVLIILVLKELCSPFRTPGAAVLISACSACNTEVRVATIQSVRHVPKVCGYQSCCASAHC